LGAVRFVDPSAEATGRLVYEAIRALRVPVSSRAAEALFAALAMDTGWFRHSNTTPATFALASELQAAGARPSWLYEQLCEQPAASSSMPCARPLQPRHDPAFDPTCWSISDGHFHGTCADVAFVFPADPAGPFRLPDLDRTGLFLRARSTSLCHGLGGTTLARR